MKSSSQYFPVALLSAEYKEGIYEDVYSLKPNTSIDNTVEIALVRLHSEQVSRGHPVLLVHDAFANHWQWLDYGIGGVAGALVRAGYDVWLMDWRGHGLSSRNQRPVLNTLDNMAEFDLPPVIQFIEEKTAQLPTLVSQGHGCDMVLQHAAVKNYQANVVLLDAAPVWPRRVFWIPGVKAWHRTRLQWGRWHRREGREEREPSSLFRQVLRRQGWFGSWRGYDQALMKPRLKAAQDRLYWVISAHQAEPGLKRLGVDPSRITLGASARDWLALMASISPSQVPGSRDRAL
ncbi:alpha/beta hydrolase [Saccharospirillum impatiens]|uniref:alpha/beta hydrolase n=1 Tax=Saccharospirillum impatiens TaxID=169438 RepID=UPI00040C9618|nr:alpha/beta fold hydrolase [Saccharospirillum impatiens]